MKKKVQEHLLNTTEISVLTGLSESAPQRVAAQEASATKKNVQDHLLKTSEVSVLTGISESTLQRWRRELREPTPIKIGNRMIRYQASVIAAWMAQF